MIQWQKARVREKAAERSANSITEGPGETPATNMSRITESARNQECQIRIPGVCNRDPATVVWCHGNGSAAGKGFGMRAIDELGSYGCFACHNCYDRRTGPPDGMTRSDIELMFWQGHARSLVMLKTKGLLG